MTEVSFIDKLYELVDNQKSQTEVECLLTETRRKFLIEQIEAFVLNFLEWLYFQKQLLPIQYRRLDWGNIEFNNNCISLKSDVNNNNVKLSCIKHKNNSSSYSNFLLCTKILHESLEEYTIKTKRQIFYEYSNNFRNQESLNRSLSLVCNRFNIGLYELGIFSCPRSLLAGPVKVHLSNETMDFSCFHRGHLLPLNITNLKNIETNAKFALIVEKDTVFEKLLSENFLKQFYPCILLTGKGYGDIAIRCFANKLVELCHISIYGIFDCDPFGIEIMCSYKYGSLAMSYFPELAIPCLEWIGLRPSQIISDVNLTKQLTCADKKKIQSLLKRPYACNKSDLSMLENREEVFCILEQFAKSNSCDIPIELEEYLEYVARTGDALFHWFLMKRLIIVKLQENLNEFIKSGNHLLISHIRNMPVFDYSLSKGFIIEKINKFNGIPFTIQRICELLTVSRNHYSRIDKYIRAFEKNILVVSTINPLTNQIITSDFEQETLMNGIEMDTNHYDNDIQNDESLNIWHPKVEHNLLDSSNDIGMILDTSNFNSGITIETSESILNSDSLNFQNVNTTVTKTMFSSRILNENGMVFDRVDFNDEVRDKLETVINIVLDKINVN